MSPEEHDALMAAQAQALRDLEETPVDGSVERWEVRAFPITLRSAVRVTVWQAATINGLTMTDLAVATRARLSGPLREGYFEHYTRVWDRMGAEEIFTFALEVAERKALRPPTTWAVVKEAGKR